MPSTSKNDAVVEAASTLDPERLRHRYLHACDVVPVPDRFEEGVGEPEDEQVLHGLLAEEVVDAKDRRFVEVAVQDLGELDR